MHCHGLGADDVVAEAEAEADGEAEAEAEAQPEAEPEAEAEAETKAEFSNLGRHRIVARRRNVNDEEATGATFHEDPDVATPVAPVTCAVGYPRVRYMSKRKHNTDTFATTGLSVSRD